MLWVVGGRGWYLLGMGLGFIGEGFSCGSEAKIFLIEFPRHWPVVTVWSWFSFGCPCDMINIFLLLVDGELPCWFTIGCPILNTLESALACCRDREGHHPVCATAGSSLDQSLTLRHDLVTLTARHFSACLTWIRRLWRLRGVKALGRFLVSPGAC